MKKFFTPRLWRGKNKTFLIPLKRSVGFTLIELIISIAILGLIFGFSAPSLINFSNSVKIDSAAEELASIIRKAQEKSINAEKNLAWGVNFSEASIYVLYNQAGDRERYELDNKIELTKTADNLIFEKLSGRTSSNFEITLTLDNKNYKIYINSEGMINYYKQ